MARSKSNFLLLIKIALAGWVSSDASLKKIKEKTLWELLKQDKYAGARKALQVWVHMARGMNWKNPAELRSTFCSARIIGGKRVVFNIKGNEFCAHDCRAAPLIDMSLIFISEVTQGGQYRVGGCLPQATKRAFIYVLC